VSWVDLFDDLLFSGQVGIVRVSMEDTLWGSLWTSFSAGEVWIKLFWSQGSWVVFP
jgi:hypothetical protein